MIDRFDNFDFVFTKFNQNARYVIMRVSLLFRSLSLGQCGKLLALSKLRNSENVQK